MAPPSIGSLPRFRIVGGTATAPSPSSSAARAFDDSELLAAVRAGEAAVAGAFHDRIRPQVDRTIRRLLGPSDPDCDDVAQLALLEIVSTIDRYRGDCSLDGWVATITAHVVYKSIRRRRLERRVFAQIEPGDVEAIAGSPGASPGARDVINRIKSHLSSMEESRSWAFVLHDVWGYDLRETAHILGVSVAAAQSRLVRGRRELQARLAEDPELADVLEREEGNA